MVIKIFHMIVVYLLTFFVWPLNKRLFFPSQKGFLPEAKYLYSAVTDLLTLSATFCARQDDGK